MCACRDIVGQRMQAVKNRAGWNPRIFWSNIFLLIRRMSSSLFFLPIQTRRFYSSPGENVHLYYIFLYIQLILLQHSPTPTLPPSHIHPPLRYISHSYDSWRLVFGWIGRLPALRRRNAPSLSTEIKTAAIFPSFCLATENIATLAARREKKCRISPINVSSLRYC